MGKLGNKCKIIDKINMKVKMKIGFIGTGNMGSAMIKGTGYIRVCFRKRYKCI